MFTRTWEDEAWVEDKGALSLAFRYRMVDKFNMTLPEVDCFYRITGTHADRSLIIENQKRDDPYFMPKIEWETTKQWPVLHHMNWQVVLKDQSKHFKACMQLRLTLKYGIDHLAGTYIVSRPTETKKNIFFAPEDTTDALLKIFEEMHQRYNEDVKDYTLDMTPRHEQRAPAY